MVQIFLNCDIPEGNKLNFNFITIFIFLSNGFRLCDSAMQFFFLLVINFITRVYVMFGMFILIKFLKYNEDKNKNLIN